METDGHVALSCVIRGMFSAPEFDLWPRNFQMTQKQPKKKKKKKEWG